MPGPLTYLPWPYAALAIVQYEWADAIIRLYCTFRFTMNQDNKPDNAYWTAEFDGNEDGINSSLWIDQWRLQLNVLTIIANPDRVRLKFDGPTSDLMTTWGKQWEPWGWILASEVP